MYFISDDKMLDHCIRWDSYHIESPDRMRVIIDRLKVIIVINIINLISQLSCSHAIYSRKQRFFPLDQLL